ncbi:acyl-CoA dehydrogenase family protein [Aquihabitans sp. McL0605]|uniref:acyl-CoA dehydrogenase family protein n=1 Tax=Aquihabitans sp. McL0605 TaxID=3415671 RepID=UPI003CEED853
MELELTEEQAAFVETTRRFLAAASPLSAVRALEPHPDGFDREVWRRAAELGWTSLLVAEADGGGSFSDHGLTDLVLVAEEMGRVVAAGPLGPVNVVAEAVSRAGSTDQRAGVLPGLLSGEQLAAWCGPEPIDAVVTGSGLSLRGTCAAVEAGAQADHLLVAVRLEGGLSQALVPAGAPGLTITPLDGLDLVRRFAEVRFDDVAIDRARLLGPPGGAGAEIDRQWRVACVLQCAETVGALDHVFAMTLEYLGDRYSFGRPLSSYQALKHRLADDKVWLEACHGIATGAARAVAADLPNAGELTSAAMAWIGPHATELIQDCIQLHGGIGITWEHDLHLYLRRATVNRATLGTPEEHAERVATGLLGAAS